MPRKPSPRNRIGNLRYAGNDQIRLHFDKPLITSLWGRAGSDGPPYRYLSYADGEGVHILPVDDPEGENERARTVVFHSGATTSYGLALQLWRLRDDGRAFTAHVRSLPSGGKEALITNEDAVQVFKYLRLEPGKPFRSPLEHVLAGKREARLRDGLPYNQDEDLYQSGNRYRRLDWEIEDVKKPEPVPSTVQTQVPNSPTVNQITLPTPRDVGLDFDTIEELQAAIQADARKAKPEESIYLKTHLNMRKQLEKKEQQS